MSEFGVAFAAHGAGRLEEAERGYRAVLEADPKNADAWHLLGVLAQQRGQSALAVEHIRHALALSGANGAYLANLGVAHAALGQDQEAVAALEQAVDLEPGAFNAHFALANSLRSLGRREDAVERYTQALALQPQSASAHNNLGNVLQDLGRKGEAAQHYREALALQPDHARAHYNLGVILKEDHKPAEAAERFRHAIAILPTLTEAHVNLGVVLHDQGHLEDAIRHAKTAVNLNPKDAVASESLGLALCELGLLHKREGRLPAAVESLAAAVAHKPDHAVFRHNLSNALLEVGQAAEAEQHLRHAIALAPKMAESHYNLGNALKALDRVDEAIAAYETAIALKPDFVKARLNLGGMLHKQERYDEALDHYDAALRIDPAAAGVSNSRGVTLQALGRDDDALEDFRRAADNQPDLADAHRNAGLALLMRGDFGAGWDAYEWRWRCDGLRTGLRDFAYPRWQGEAGGGIVVWGEQGVGDRVLYAGMIPDLLARGHKVVMETDKRLKPLFERSFPGVAVVAKENPFHPLTQSSEMRWHSPLASLGRWLRPDAQSFPKREAYLVADAARTRTYRAALETAQPGSGLIVGISWVSRSPKIGQHKSLDLRQWAPILKVPGVRFVDLQYGDTVAERAEIEAELGVSITHLPDLDLREDIDGIAALIAACDLVISVSNTTVHLAAALGRPTWVLVPATAGNLWYWMRGQNPTPWYSSTTIFRQTRPNHWDDIIQIVEKKLKDFSAA